MFAGIFKALTEPFTTFTTTQSEPHRSQEMLRRYYSEKRPNAILSKTQHADTNFAAATNTYMGSGFDQLQLNERKPALQNEFILTTNSMTGDLVGQRQAECEGSGGDQFAHLSNLAANVNGKSRFRCGWVYNEETPSSGRGAYGTIDGPMQTTAEGTWMWDLNAAKKKYHLSICKPISACSDLNNDIYRNKCGFCKNTKKGVPIIGSVAAYPYDPMGACSSANLILSSGMCPKPAPPPPPGTPAAAIYMETREVCDPLPGGKYPRDCYVKKAQQAGCSDDGALITALKSGSDTNYIDTLTTKDSYQLYQERAAAGLSETYLRYGNMTGDTALSEFSALQDTASSAANQGLKAAAADLCFTSGMFEEFDFCTEIQPGSSTVSVSLDCIQAEFKRAGGQETGTLYPTAITRSVWDSKPKWSDVQTYIQDLKGKTASTDRATQERAVSQFYGINLDRRLAILGDVNNVEIFWFTADPDVKNGTTTYNTTFLGRRIRSALPNLTGGSTPTGNSFVYFTNFKPAGSMNVNIKFTGDSGFIFLKNGAMSNRYNGNGADNTNAELSSLYPSFGNPASQMTTGSAWTFGTTDNIITGYYLGNGNNYNLQYKLSGSIPGGPCYCFGKTQNGIRIYTRAECDRLGGNWHGNGECTKPEGGSHSWDCRDVNNATCISAPAKGNDWDQFPADRLYLIQHPYAPMVKFSVRSNFSLYGADYAFCDKRLGSHKMKFRAHPNGGPTTQYIADNSAASPPTYNLDKSYMQFSNGSGMMSLFLLKMYSFMTMVIKIKFTSLPSSGVSETPLVLWPGSQGVDFPSIIITGMTATTAKLGVGSYFNKSSQTQSGPSAYGVVSPGKSTNDPTISINTDYIVTLKAVRTNENDISTLVGMKVGAAKVSDLQTNPSSLQESSLVTWPNKLQLENMEGNNNRFIYVNASSAAFNLYSIELYDYVLAGDNLQHAANIDWPLGPQGSNPYK